MCRTVGKKAHAKRKMREYDCATHEIRNKPARLVPRRGCTRFRKNGVVRLGDCFSSTDILDWQQSTMFQADSYSPARAWCDIELHISAAFGNFALLISKTYKNRVSSHFPDVWFDALRSLSGQKFKVVDVSLQGDHGAMVTISFSSTWGT